MRRSAQLLAPLQLGFASRALLPSIQPRLLQPQVSKFRCTSSSRSMPISSQSTSSNIHAKLLSTPPIPHRQETDRATAAAPNRPVAALLQASCDSSAASPPRQYHHQWTQHGPATDCTSTALPSGSSASSTDVSYQELLTPFLPRKHSTWGSARDWSCSSVASDRQYQSATQSDAQPTLWMQPGRGGHSTAARHEQQQQQQRGYAATKHYAPSQAVRESIGHQMLRSFVDSPGMLAEPYTCAYHNLDKLMQQHAIRIFHATRRKRPYYSPFTLEP